MTSPVCFGYKKKHWLVQAARGLNTLVNNGSGFEQIYSKDAVTTPDSAGRKAMQWHTLAAAGMTAMQCVAAYEKVCYCAVGFGLVNIVISSMILF